MRQAEGSGLGGGVEVAVLERIPDPGRMLIRPGLELCGSRRGVSHNMGAAAIYQLGGKKLGRARESEEAPQKLGLPRPLRFNPPVVVKKAVADKMTPCWITMR